ncbi:MAG: hypothetical protein INF43_03340 [Alphaproteobacteria bacterium]|nr:hypothetical protein [Alphaproteobacteria bacterium]
MQTILVLAVFSLFMGILSSLVLGSGSNSAQLNKALQKETAQYFRAVEQVVNSELTPNQLEVAPPSWTAEQILTQPALRQLAPGRWGDPMRDSWGSPIRANTRFLRQNIALSAQAVAPITGFILISAGPDRVFQTTLNSPTTLAALQGVVPPSGSDDIVVAFTDEDSQRVVLANLTTRLERIANAMLRDYQTKMTIYRGTIEANYRTTLQTNPAAAPPDWNTLLLTDPNAPRFADITDTTVRNDLGVTEEFAYLERLLPGNGRMEVTLTSADLRQGATLQLVNFSASPSPWSVVNLSIPLKGGFN